MAEDIKQLKARLDTMYNRAKTMLGQMTVPARIKGADGAFAENNYDTFAYWFTELVSKDALQYVEDQSRGGGSLIKTCAEYSARYSGGVTYEKLNMYMDAAEAAFNIWDAGIHPPAWKFWEQEIPARQSWYWAVNYACQCAQNYYWYRQATGETWASDVTPNIVNDGNKKNDSDATRKKEENKKWLLAAGIVAACYVGYRYYKRHKGV